MPYKYGHYGVGLVLLVTILGFWTSYFVAFTHVPFAFHMHGVTATTWLLLLIAQSLAAHTKNIALHRTMGKASFLLFPLLIVGFVAIINLSAARYADAEGAFIAELGPAFGIGMGVAISAYLTLFYLALRNRRNIKLHAGFMLATPLILFESPFSRVIPILFPWLNVIGSEGPRELLDLILIGNLISASVALVLYLTNRRHGLPWLLVIAFTTLQTVTMWFANDIPGVRAIFAFYAQLPATPMLFVGFAAGALVAWLGWERGKPVARSAPSADAALS